MAGLGIWTRGWIGRDQRVKVQGGNGGGGSFSARCGGFSFTRPRYPSVIRDRDIFPQSIFADEKKENRIWSFSQVIITVPLFLFFVNVSRTTFHRYCQHAAGFDWSLVFFFFSYSCYSCMLRGKHVLFFFLVASFLFFFFFFLEGFNSHTMIIFLRVRHVQVLVQFLQHETCGKVNLKDNTGSTEKRYISHATRRFPRRRRFRVRENEREGASSVNT